MGCCEMGTEFVLTLIKQDCLISAQLSRPGREARNERTLLSPWFLKLKGQPTSLMHHALGFVRWLLLWYGKDFSEKRGGKSKRKRENASKINCKACKTKFKPLRKVTRNHPVRMSHCHYGWTITINIKVPFPQSLFMSTHNIHTWGQQRIVEIDFLIFCFFFISFYRATTQVKP